jgi:hypothetical protein
LVRGKPVRQAADPDAVLLEFLQTTYEAAADLARWDRDALERDRQPLRGGATERLSMG